MYAIRARRAAVPSSIDDVSRLDSRGRRQIHRPAEADLALLRRRRAELRHMKHGKKLIADQGKLAPKRVYFRAHNLLTTGDGTPGAEMGIDKRVHRGCEGQARLRLDHRRSHLRHVSRTRREAVRADRVHAEGAVHHAGALSAQMDADGEVRRDLHRLGVSAQGLRQVGRAGLPVGEALRGEVRARGSRAVVLGDLERGEHRLLARHAGGVPEAARLRD